MHIPPIGYLVLAIGFFALLLRQKYLLWCVVISVPLWQVVVFEIEPLSFVVSPTMLFIVLLTVKFLVDSVVRGRIVLPYSQSYFLLLLFLTSVLLSQVMPILINGDTSAPAVEGSFLPFETHPIEPGRINLTQSLYMVFWSVAFIGLVHALLRSKVDINAVVKAVVLMGVLVALTSFANLSLRLADLDSLALDMYTILGGRDSSFLNKNVAGVPRPYSIAGEPGWSSLFMVFAAGLVMPALFRSTLYLWSYPVNFVVFAIMILGIGFGGTTGLIGLAIMFPLGLVVLKKKLPLGRYLRRIWLFASLVLITAILAILVADILGFSASDYFNKAHIQKLSLESGSGSVRLLYAVENLRLFLQYPILGVGFGSSASNSLLTALLSNIGMIGTLSFLGFNMFLFTRAHRAYLRSNDFRYSMMAAGVLIGAMSFLGAALIAKSMGTLTARSWYWVIMALLMSASHLSFKRLSRPRQHNSMGGSQ